MSSNVTTFRAIGFPRRNRAPDVPGCGELRVVAVKYIYPPTLMEIKLHLSRKPTGKVAQLPPALIEYVNQSIHDGVEYKTIMQHLAEKGHHGINKFNLTRWRRSGHAQW